MNNQPETARSKLIGLSQDDSALVWEALDQILPLEPDGSFDAERPRTDTAFSRSLTFKQQLWLGVLMFFRQKLALAWLGVMVLPITVLFLLYRLFNHFL